MLRRGGEAEYKSSGSSYLGVVGSGSSFCPLAPVDWTRFGEV